MFPDISDAMAAGGFTTSIDFAQALLDEQRVAVTPGEAFDSPGFIRMSYATWSRLAIMPRITPGTMRAWKG